MTAATPTPDNNQDFPSLHHSRQKQAGICVYLHAFSHRQSGITTHPSFAMYSFQYNPCKIQHCQLHTEERHKHKKCAGPSNTVVVTRFLYGTSQADGAFNIPCESNLRSIVGGNRYSTHNDGTTGKYTHLDLCSQWIHFCTSVAVTSDPCSRSFSFSTRLFLSSHAVSRSWGSCLILLVVPFPSIFQSEDTESATNRNSKAANQRLLTWTSFFGLMLCRKDAMAMYGDNLSEIAR